VTSSTTAAKAKTSTRPATKDVLASRDPSLPRPVATKAGWNDLDVRAVDTARLLAADAVQKVGNGHPGTAMSLAPLAYLLYQNVMRHDPSDPAWLGRDRFVLSCGHSSLTQYVQLFLSGYGMSLDDLKSLRTWGSQTPGHPEVHHTAGVEITTGPLGSGLASAVGMAMAQRRQRGLFDPDAKQGASPFDHHVYVIASDGDMQEGVSHEACSLAGHQELGNLTVIYDANQISIEDDTDISFSEDVAKRYEAYGWDVVDIDWRRSNDRASYVEDVDALLAAIRSGEKQPNKPTLVVLRTIIAWPAPTKQDTGKAHGSALGDEEVSATKTLLGFDPKKAFVVEPAVLKQARDVVKRGKAAHREWDTSFKAWRKANPQRAALLDRLLAGDAPAGLDAGAVGRVRGPGRVQQHDHGGRALVHPRLEADERVEGQPLRSDAALRDPRARDGDDPQRHRARGPHPAVRRHLPRVLRLHAPGGPARGAPAAARHLRVDA
jgi:transketolase